MLKTIPQPGTKIRCIDNEGCSSFLTNGKIYEVLSATNKDFEYMDDDGDILVYRFKGAEDVKFEVVPETEIKIGDFVKLKDWDVFLEVLAVDYDTNSIKIAQRTTDEIYTAWYNISQGFIKQEEDKMEKQDDFRVGDIVWCVISGKGKVKVIFSDGREYPLYVVFDSGDYNYYTLDGKYLEKGNRSLFFSEPKIEAAVTRPFIPTLVGKKVVVRYFDGTCSSPLKITDENESMLWYDDNNSVYKSGLTGIYEVQSKNLLKK